MGDRACWFVTRFFAAISCLACCSFASAADKDFALLVEPVFIGASPGSDIPLLVTMSNNGPDAQGELVVETEGFRMRYPVQLPRNSKKKLTAYLHGLRDFGEISVELDTDEGGTRVTYHDADFMGMHSRPIVLITDHPGQMGFLKTRGNEEEADMYSRYGAVYLDSYVKPGTAPERALAYNNLPAVILGDGAERLSDGAVRALRQWVRMGGTVVFVGGASAPVLSDSRWEDLLPVEAGANRTLGGSSMLATLGGSPVTEPFAVTVGRPISGTEVLREGDVPMVVTRHVGMGRTIFLAFNPFEGPVDKWKGRRKLFTQGIDMTHTSRATGWLQTHGRTLDHDYYAPYARYSYETGDSGPFSAKMPATGTIVMLLLLYFVLIVPVNLVVLRLKGRGELAWITSPVISLAFAGIFFTFAGNLYSADLSVAPRGMLVLDAPSGNGYFVGDTQIFFPRGGSYDLQMENTEYLTAKPNMEDFYAPPSGRRRQDNTVEVMNAADVGDIRVQNMAVSNLSFHQFSFGQVLENERMVTANVKFEFRPGVSGLVADGSITNNSRYKLEQVQIAAGSYKGTVGSIEPGATVKVQGVVMRKVPTARVRDRYGYGYEGYSDAQLTEFLGKGNVALFAELKGFRPGPKVGRLVDQETHIMGVIFLSNLRAPEAG